MNRRFVLACLALFSAALAAYAVGLGWGLPSSERFSRVLTPDQRNDAFYEKVENARRALYSRVGPNIQAAFGRGEWNGAVAPAGSEELALHGYSGFALRSVEQDEQFILNALSRFKPKKLQFNPHQFLYGGSYLYPLAAWLAVLHVVHAVRLDPDPLYYYRDPSRIGRLYEAGRWFSALSALACVALVLLIGREAAGDETGLWAAALFAFSPAVVCFAHVLKPHMPAALGALACVLFCARWARGDARAPLWAGACFGLAVGAAKNHWVLALPIVAAALAAQAWRPDARAVKWAAIAGVVGVAVFFLVNPYAPFEFRDFLDETRALTTWYKPSLTLGQLKDFAFGPWRAGAGAPLAALSIAAGLWALAWPKAPLFKTAVLWGTLVIGASFVAGAMSYMDVSARFFIAGFGVSSVLAASVLTSFESKAARAAGRVVLAAVTLSLIVRTAALAANFAADRPGHSHAFEAADWIDANIPAGAEIGVRASVPMADRFPPVVFSRYRLVPIEPGNVPARLPRWCATNARWLGPGQPGLDAYHVVKTFGGDSRLERLADDRFTSANFPVAILELPEEKK